MNIWIAQYLCPARHALAASPYDRDAIEPRAHETALIEEMTRNGLEFRCGICGSRALHFEHGKLPWTDWDTALRALRNAEVDNILTRIAIEGERQNRN